MITVKDVIKDIIGYRPKKYLPTRAYEALVWSKWEGHNRWTKKRVIEQAYERNPVFYAACNIIAQTVADMPIYVRYKAAGKYKDAFDHPILGLFDRDMSKEETIERLVLYLIVTGESYSQVIFSGEASNLRPLGLIVLPSQHMTPIYGDQYKPIQKYKFSYLKEKYFNPKEIIYICKPDLSNYFQGMSPGVPLAELIDLNNAGITWNKNIALSGGIPPVIAKSAGGIDEIEAQEIRDKWQEQSGAINAHRLKILSGDLELQNLSVNPHDAEWPNALLMTMRWILMSLGLSSSMMNDAGNKTYNNVKDSRKAFYTDACLPLAHRVYRKISRELRPYYKDNPEIMIHEAGIESLQEDMERQAKRLKDLVDSGILSRNEARAEMGKSLSDDPIADKLIISNTPTPVAPPEEPVQI